MENMSKFELNKPPLHSEEEDKKTQDLPKNNPVMDRRRFLKLAAIGAASLLVNPDEVLAKQEKKEKTEAPAVKLEVLIQGKHRKIIGESIGLNALHTAVSNNFEGIIEREIKRTSNKLAISNFKAFIGRKNGKYMMEYSVNLTPVNKEGETHRMVGIRGKVWSGNGAKEGVNKLYAKEIGPWQQRMQEAHPDMKFSSEAQSGGSDNLYQRVCLMKGTKSFELRNSSPSIYLNQPKPSHRVSHIYLIHIVTH